MHYKNVVQYKLQATYELCIEANSDNNEPAI